MERKYSEGLTQVNEVLKYTDPDLINKIPDSFKNFITENMSKSYEFTIDESVTNENIHEILSPEAKSFLGLIYRNYLVSPEEKEKLLELERENILKKEELLIKKNIQNINEVFPQNTEQNNTQNLMPVKQKEKWYISLLEKLLNKLKGLN